MKNLFALTFVSVLFLFSCGSNESKKEATESDATIEKLAKPGDLKAAKNCDEFIEQYDEWMNDYLKMMEKYMKNPLDQELMSEYMEVAQEGMTWMNNWTNLAACASREKYQKRFDEISERADKKMEELGL